MSVALLSSIVPETHYSRHLYAELSKIAPEVTLLARDSAETDRYRDSLGRGEVIGLWRSPWRLPFLLRRFCVRRKVAVLHLQHEFNMYHRTYGFGALIFLLALVAGRVSARKVVVTIHAVVGRDQIDSRATEIFELHGILTMRRVFALSLALFYRTVAWLSDCTVVHTVGMREILIRDYGADRSRCIVIPHGIAEIPPPPTPESVERVRALMSGRYIFSFGFLVRRKGIEELIDAFAAAGSALEAHTLVIGGRPLGRSDAYERELKALVSRLGLEGRVHFPGFLSEFELAALLHGAEIVVAPHSFSVSSSGVVALAIGAGKPVVVTDQPAFREMLEENREALFFRSGDAEGLGAKLLALIRDARMREELSTGANRLRERLSWRRIAMLHSEMLYA